MQDPYAKRFLKDVKTTKTKFIANSGGILGLCMGFSLISFAEIVFHCLAGVVCPGHFNQEEEEDAKGRKKEKDRCLQKSRSLI